MQDQPKVAPKMFEFGGADDYQLRQAVNFIEGRKVKRKDPALVLTSSKNAAAAAAGKKDHKETEQGSPEQKKPKKNHDPGAKYNTIRPEDGINGNRTMKERKTSE